MQLRRAVRDCDGTAGHHFTFDPAICPLKAIAEANGWLPSEPVKNQRIVAVASQDTFGSVEVVDPLEPDAGDLLNDIHKPVDGDDFVRSQIQGFGDVAMHDQFCALNAILDEHEAARLLSIAPDVYLVRTRQLRFDDLAADGRGSLFPSTGPCALRTVHVVVASDTAAQARFLFKVAAQALAEELLPAVAIFRESGIRIRFFQRVQVWSRLLCGVVDTGG